MTLDFWVFSLSGTLELGVLDFLKERSVLGPYSKLQVTTLRDISKGNRLRWRV